MRILTLLLSSFVALVMFAGSAVAQRAMISVTDTTLSAGGKASVTFSWKDGMGPGYSGAGVQLTVNRKSVGTIDMKTPVGTHTVTFDLATVGLAAGRSSNLVARWSNGHVWGNSISKPGGEFTIPARAQGMLRVTPTESKLARGKVKPKAVKKIKVPAPKGADSAPKEKFEQGMPLQYNKPLWQGARPSSPGKRAVRGTATSSLGGPADIGGLPNATRNFAMAGSLLESEGKVGIRNKAQLRKTIAILKHLSNDPRLAAKVLGKGWSVKYVATYTFKDRYMDNKNRDLARTEGGLRKREVPGSGQPAQLNYKDPFGNRDGPNGIVMSRTERFIDLGPKANIRKLVDTNSHLNPMQSVLRSGKQPSSFAQDSAVVLDKRVRFQLNYKEPGKRGPPQTVADISADHVFDFQSKMGKGKHNRVSFFGLEVDIAHQPVDGSGKSVDYIAGVKNWKSPHKPADLKHLAKDKSIQKAYQVIANLVGHLTNHGVQLRATVPKYTEGLLRAGHFKPVTKMQRDVLRRNRYLQAKNPLSRVQRAASKKAATRARARAR